MVNGLGNKSSRYKLASHCWSRKLLLGRAHKTWGEHVEMNRTQVSHQRFQCCVWRYLSIDVFRHIIHSQLRKPRCNEVWDQWGQLTSSSWSSTVIPKPGNNSYSNTLTEIYKTNLQYPARSVRKYSQDNSSKQDEYVKCLYEHEQAENAYKDHCQKILNKDI